MSLACAIERESDVTLGKIVHLANVLSCFTFQRHDQGKENKNSDPPSFLLNLHDHRFLFFLVRADVECFITLRMKRSLMIPYET